MLHVINGEDYSGAERVQDLLALRLPDWGFEVGFACVKPNLFARMRQAQSAPLHEVPMRSRLDLAPIVRLARLIRREGYELVHSHSARTALLARPAAALARVPLIHHVHCQTNTEVERRWLSRISGVIERISMNRVAGIVAVSDSLRRYLLRHGYAADRIWTIPNGVPTEGPLTGRPQPDSGWIIGTVAMFRPRKGIEVLLEAVAKLRAQGLAARLRAVGRFQTPEYEHQVKQFAARLNLDDAVDWVGFQQNVSRELRQMDVFVLPSLISEAMPMSVLEAMAAGVLVIGTRVDGVTDLVRDGVDGLLANPRDAQDLARVLGRVVRGEVDWGRMRESAYQRQVERFSDRSMTAGIAQMYRDVLARRARTSVGAKEAA